MFVNTKFSNFTLCSKIKIPEDIVLNYDQIKNLSSCCWPFITILENVYFNGENIELLVGVGYPTNKPRTEHEEVLNKQILAEDRRTGKDNEKWLFPSFTKKMKIEKL